MYQIPNVLRASARCLDSLSLHSFNSQGILYTCCIKTVKCIKEVYLKL